MQVLSVPLRALLFCFDFIFGKGSRVKSSLTPFSHFQLRIKQNFASLLKYKIQDVTPTVLTPTVQMCPLLCMHRARSC